MTSVSARIVRKAGVLRNRFRYEVVRPRLSAADIDRRLVSDARGDVRSADYYRQLYRQFLRTTVHGYRDPRAVRVTLGDPVRERSPYRLAGHAAGGVDPETVNWHTDPVSGRPWPRKWLGAIADRRPGSELVVFLHYNKMWFLLDHSAAYVQTGDPSHAERWFAVVDSWCRQNPYLVGMNWRSPMDIGTRLATWSVGLSEIGEGPWATPARLRRLFESVVRHAEYLSEHFSRWEIPNNHLISNAATLYTFATLWPILERAEQWREISEEVLTEEAGRQVLPDGFQFENSVCYHTLVLDFLVMYLVAKTLRGETPPAAITGAVAALAGALLRLISPGGRLPRFGDDSMVEFFTIRSAGDLAERRLGDAVKFGDLVKPEYVAVLGRAGWGRELLERRCALASAHHFAFAGFTVVRTPRSHLVLSAGPEHDRRISDGHIHSDGGSFELELEGVPVVVDGGTFVYLNGESARRHFTGMRAHNSVFVDGVEPMGNAGAFHRKSVPRGRTVARRLEGSPWVVAVARMLPGEGGASFLHRRVVLQLGTEVWIIADALNERVTPAGGAHADPGGAGPPAGGGLHRMDALIHTPFSAVDISVATATRVEIRVPGARQAGDAESGPGRVGIERIAVIGEAGGGDGTEILTAADDERTWYSPWFGELRHGLTVHTSAQFAGSIVFVHAITREGARVEEAAVEPGPLRLIAHTAGGTRSISIVMDPISIELDGVPVELSREDENKIGSVQP